MFIQTQPTPNPTSLMFQPGQKVMEVRCPTCAARCSCVSFRGHAHLQQVPQGSLLISEDMWQSCGRCIAYEAALQLTTANLMPSSLMPRELSRARRLPGASSRRVAALALLQRNLCICSLHYFMQLTR